MTASHKERTTANIAASLYNHSRLQYSPLHTQSNTILTQSDPRKKEVLVIDDGSTDDTLQVARSFAEKDNRVRVFSQKNSGVSVARNRGITEARGEYILFLDSDDWFENDAVETLLDAQEKYPDSLVAAKYYFVDMNTFSKRFFSGKRDIPSQILSIRDVVEHFSGEMGASPDVCAKIFRSEIIRRNNLQFREGKCYGEDGLFMFEYLNLAGSFFYLNRYIVNVLARQDSVTRSSYRPDKARSVIDTYGIMFSHPNNTAEVKKFIIRRRNYFLTNLLTRAFSEDVPDSEIKYVRQYLTSPYFLIPECNDTLKGKISFIIKRYFPVRAVRAMLRFKAAVKRILNPSQH